jgi:hypothetical protein
MAKPRWSHDLETIELLNSTNGTRVGPANRHAEKRETLGWPALTGAFLWVVSWGYEFGSSGLCG